MTNKQKKHALRAISGLLALCTSATLMAATANVYQMYYVPTPESEVTAFNRALNSATGDEIRSVVSISVVLDGTRIYFDQHEDGYETDVTNPQQPTTGVWGDGDPGNGIPPGFSTDELHAGDVVVLDQTYDVTTSVTCTDLTDCRLDGGDRFGSSKALSVTRSAYNTSPGSVLAGAVEMDSDTNWSDTYTLPIGVDTANEGGEIFETVSAMVMAGDSATTVTLNGAGAVTLQPGETHVFADVSEGDVIAGDAPTQLTLLTGDIDSSYESRWYRVPATSQWSDEYYSPVGTVQADDPAHYFLYNPGSTPLDVTVEDDGGIAATVTVPAGSSAEYTGTSASGQRFFADAPFYAMAVVDADETNNVHDWGFSLVPSLGLTGQSVIGFAPGTEDLSQADMSPVWVTAVADTTVCVDFDRDGTIDQTTPLDRLESLRITDTGDNDMTGALIYSINDPNGDNAPTICDSTGDDDTQTDIAPVWGQNPATSTTGAPAIDIGTTVLAVPKYAVSKRTELLIDADGSTTISPGDTVLFRIEVDNYGALPLNDATLTDSMPAELDYDPNNSDSGWVCGGSPLVCQLGPFSLAAFSTQAYDLAAVIPEDAVSVSTIENTVTLDPGTGEPPADGGTATPVRTARLGDRIWNDLNGDGVQDAGEPGIADVTVELRDGTCTPGGDCPTTTTDGTGAYAFTGLTAGDYTVAVQPPTGGSATYDADGTGSTHQSSVTVTEGADVVDQDFGYRFTGRIGDRIWEDRDGDGIQDAGEPGIGGVTVELRDDTCTPGSDCVTVTTDADGGYVFESVAAGDYTVAVTAPAGTEPTADPDGGLDDIAAVTLTNGDEVLDQDFGYRFMGRIGGRIWEDIDGDGIQDAGEPGVANHPVELRDSSCTPDNLCETTRTDSDGNYLFDAVVDGDYTVYTNPPADIGITADPDGDLDGFTTVTVTDGGDVLDQDFGYMLGNAGGADGSIAGNVWEDVDDDGQRDAGEPLLDGMTVTLEGGACRPTCNTTTDANGHYAFSGLSADSYTIRVDGNGPDMTAVYDSDGGTDERIDLTLADGESATAQDFAYRRNVATPTGVPAIGLPGLVLLVLSMLGIGWRGLPRRHG